MNTITAIRSSRNQNQKDSTTRQKFGFENEEAFLTCLESEKNLIAWVHRGKTAGT